MIEQDIYLESVRERDIDLLLIEELHVEPTFKQFIFASLLPRQDAACFVGAWHSVSTHHGESDLIAIFINEVGKRIALLIENKINASAQFRQSERYIERGKEGVANDMWDEFVTCLFAPQSYLNSDNQNYQTTLSYEEVQRFFVDMKTTRANYKSKVIQAAIEQQRRSKQREVNEASTQFAHKLSVICRVIIQILQSKKSYKVAPSDTVGFTFIHSQIHQFISFTNAVMAMRV